MTKEKSLITKIQDSIRASLIAGILTVIPLGITYFVLSFLFRVLDGFLSPLIKKWVGHSIPGLGIVVMVVLLYIVGLLARNVFGVALIRLGEGILERLPIIKNVYQASKQIVQAFSMSGKKSFQRVVVIEYPRPGLKALAFVTGTHIEKDSGKKYISVFVPTTPNPTSGVLEFVPEEQAVDIGISVEEAIKLVVSAGVLLPGNFSLNGTQSED